MKNKNEKEVKAWAVLGDYGFTAAFSNEMRAEKEQRRIHKTGYSAAIIPCTITYSLPPKKKKS